MINKIYKTIHNRFSIFFKFVFFIRYLFLVFFVATFLFLVIPHFFDFKKKEKTIYDYLLKSYDLQINEIETIKYGTFPVPHLKIINSKGNLFSKDISIKINHTIRFWCNTTNLSIDVKLCFSTIIKFPTLIWIV